MEQFRRSVTFVVLICAVYAVWFGFVQPRFFPAPVPKPAPPAALADADPPAPAGVVPAGDKLPGGQAAPDAAPAAQLQLPNHPRRTVTLGSLDPASGYFQRVTLTSRGAAVRSIELNDPRYRELTARDAPLHVVGGDAGAKTATFATPVPAIDETLTAFDTDSSKIDWQVAKLLPDPQNPKLVRGAVFRLRAADGSAEVFKSFSLRRVEGSERREVRDAVAGGYMLDAAVTLRNLSDAPRPLSYGLQGPVGLPLENQEHTSKYRDLELGFLDADGDLNASSMPATDVTEKAKAAEAVRDADADAAKASAALARNAEKIAVLSTTLKAEPADQAAAAQLAKAQADGQELAAYAATQTEAAKAARAEYEVWKTPFRYLGVEVQYFAALLFPDDGRSIEKRFAEPRVEAATPQLVAAAQDAKFNDVSFTLTTNPVAVPAGGSVRQAWTLFAGPKRKALLAPLGAEDVLDLGNLFFFRFGWVAAISNAMLWIMGGLHAAGFPYWLAIISLTVIVRGCMFPLSRKQAIGAAKMKELQPKITELKAKFGDDREGMAKAQMELFAKHGYNPLAGCLPIFFQLPIFIGLYQALQTSVDLRMAGFLWIDNLAAPDQLARLPINLPVLGRDFNLLPLVTVALFYVQQKMFMPPATTPEQEAQFKMMNVMTLVMGFFFYHVPAGLCVYFIASSLWSITERKLLANTKAAHVGPAEAAEVDREIKEAVSHKKSGKFKPAEPEPPRAKTWLEKLMERADAARQQAEQGQTRNEAKTKEALRRDSKNANGKGNNGKGNNGKSRSQW